MIESKATSRPAQKYGNRGAWQAEADHMRAHPGDTFVIERRPHPNKAAYALAAHVRSGGYVAFRPAGSFDAWVEREGGNVEVIAVFVGEGTQAQDEAGTVASRGDDKEDEQRDKPAARPAQEPEKSPAPEGWTLEWVNTDEVARVCDRALDADWLLSGVERLRQENSDLCAQLDDLTKNDGFYQVEDGRVVLLDGKPVSDRLVGEARHVMSHLREPGQEAVVLFGGKKFLIRYQELPPGAKEVGEAEEAAWEENRREVRQKREAERQARREAELEAQREAIEQAIEEEATSLVRNYPETRAQEDPSPARRRRTVATRAEDPAPAPGTTPDSGGEVESFSALRARLETLPPGDRSDAVVAWIGTLPLKDRHELIIAMAAEHLAETGQSFDDWWREGTGQSFDDWCRAHETADADPKPARKTRTVATRAEDPAPETVAAPQVPSLEAILPAVKEAASSATKTYLSVGDLAKLTGHASDDIRRALDAVGVVSRRKDGKYQPGILALVPTRFADFRVLEVSGDYRHEHTARLRWDFTPGGSTYYSAWKRMACHHLVPGAADTDDDGFHVCECKLVLFYQQDGASDVTVLADYGDSPATLPVALTPFGQ